MISPDTARGRPPAAASSKRAHDEGHQVKRTRSAGLDGVRTVIGSPYLIGRLQQRDASDKLNMVNHGVHVIQDINAGAQVPGLAPLLDRLAVAVGDAKEAVLTSFGWSAGGTGGSVALPTQSTWDTLDYANQKKNDVYGLVDSLRGSCSP
jgi:hypothetical protein